MATYQQLDWTGEELVNDLMDHCLFCSSPLLNLRGALFGVGRLSLYCSDACKMKAYRKRSKALRIVQHHSQQLTPPIEVQIDIQAQFHCHQLLFRNVKTAKLLIPFFSPVSLYVTKTLYSPFRMR